MRCKSGAMVDLIDASSLLYRLQMEGICIETAGIAVGGGGGGGAGSATALPLF